MVLHRPPVAGFRSLDTNVLQQATQGFVVLRTRPWQTGIQPLAVYHQRNSHHLAGNAEAEAVISFRQSGRQLPMLQLSVGNGHARSRRAPQVRSAVSRIWHMDISRDQSSAI